MQSDRARAARPASAPPPPTPRSHLPSLLASGAVPAGLRHRFVRFRRTHARMTRIPDDLRRAVLDAVDQGTSMPALRRDLGLTAKQVAAWARHRPRPGPAEAVFVPPHPSRVFAVTDGPSGSEQSAVPSDAPEALELRLGAWSIVIRSSRS